MSCFKHYFGVLLVLGFFPGCAATGLVQTRSVDSQNDYGSVQVIGPLLRPQTIAVEQGGTTIDRIVAEARRAGELSNSLNATEMVYRQRGVTRVFIPSFLIQSTSLGDVRILPGDAVCCIPLEQTPLATRTPTSSPSFIVQGLLTTQPEGFRNTTAVSIEAIGPNVYAFQHDGSFDNALKRNVTRISDLNICLTLDSDSDGTIDDLSCGITRGANFGTPDELPPDITVVRRIADDGFVEEYVLPTDSTPGKFSSVDFSTAVAALFIVGGDTLEFTRVELLPYALEGHVVAMLSESGTVLTDQVVEKEKKKCTVQAGPLLQPFSAIFRNSAQQSSAVLRNSLRPASDLLRAQPRL